MLPLSPQELLSLLSCQAFGGSSFAGLKSSLPGLGCSTGAPFLGCNTELIQSRILCSITLIIFGAVNLSMAQSHGGNCLSLSRLAVGSMGPAAGGPCGGTIRGLTGQLQVTAQATSRDGLRAHSPFIASTNVYCTNVTC